MHGVGGSWHVEASIVSRCCIEFLHDRKRERERGTEKAIGTCM